MTSQHRNLLPVCLLAASSFLTGCSSLKLVFSLDEHISELRSSTNANTEKNLLVDRRLNQLELQLTGITLRTIRLEANTTWKDIYANQSGTEKSINVALVCDEGTSCGSTNTSVRVLRILADAELDKEFPEIEDTAVIDTGPLDLTLAGSTRDFVVPRGFRIVAKTFGPDPVDIKLIKSE